MDLLIWLLYSSAIANNFLQLFYTDEHAGLGINMIEQLDGTIHGNKQRI